MVRSARRLYTPPSPVAVLMVRSARRPYTPPSPVAVLLSPGGAAPRSTHDTASRIGGATDRGAESPVRTEVPGSVGARAPVWSGSQTVTSRGRAAAPRP